MLGAWIEREEKRREKREREKRKREKDKQQQLIVDLDPPPPSKNGKNPKTTRQQLDNNIQCDEELALIPKMAAWKPWDVKAGHTVELRIEKPVE